MQTVACKQEKPHSFRVAVYFAELGQRVLFVDLDPQRNGTSTLDAHAGALTASALFLDTVQIEPLSEPGICVVPSEPAISLSPKRSAAQPTRPTEP